MVRFIDLFAGIGGFHQALQNLGGYECVFERKLWPAFTEKDYLKIIKDYKNIKRNFGKI